MLVYEISPKLPVIHGNIPGIELHGLMRHREVV